MKSLVNFLANELKNVFILSKMAEKDEFEDTNPLKKKKKIHTSDSFAFRTVLILKSHMKTQHAYFVKWRL